MAAAPMIIEIQTFSPACWRMSPMATTTTIKTYPSQRGMLASCSASPKKMAVLSLRVEFFTITVPLVPGDPSSAGRGPHRGGGRPPARLVVSPQVGQDRTVGEEIWATGRSVRSMSTRQPEQRRDLGIRAQPLGTSCTLAYQLVSTGQLPHIRLGKGTVMR
jgi:hypothetical protein